MEIKYNALVIKGWLIENISPLGWSTLVSRALPELLEVNSRFSAYFVNKNTKWGEEEILVIRWYLMKMFDKDFPDEILDKAVDVHVKYWNINSINFFNDSATNMKTVISRIKSFFNF